MENRKELVGKLREIANRIERNKLDYRYACDRIILDKLYDDIVDDLTETNQIEYIEKLYNLNFEMIGYKRYRA